VKNPPILQIFPPYSTANYELYSLLTWLDDEDITHEIAVTKAFKKKKEKIHPIKAGFK
jgi:hypothetical protein